MNFLYFNFPVCYNQIKYSYDKDVLMSKKRRKSKNTIPNDTVSIPAASAEEETVITPKHKKRHIKAKHIYQQDKWPTGCESVSAVMALHYAGIDISVDHFINNCLEKKTPPFDPNIQFGGDPHDSGGWGCYSPVITKALDKALKGTKFTAKQLVNVPVETLCAKYIDKDIPVIFWATIDMQKPEESPQKWNYNGTYIDYWMRPEHCLLLVGYNEDSYIFCDPWKKENYTYYKKDKVVTAYKGEYSQAVVITKR